MPALITITSISVEGAGHVMETLGPTGAYSGASGSDNTFPLSSDLAHPHTEGHRSHEFVPGPVASPSLTMPGTYSGNATCSRLPRGLGDSRPLLWSETLTFRGPSESADRCDRFSAHPHVRTKECG